MIFSWRYFERVATYYHVLMLDVSWPA